MAVQVQVVGKGRLRQANARRGRCAMPRRSSGRACRGACRGCRQRPDHRLRRVDLLSRDRVPRPPAADHQRDHAPFGHRAGRHPRRLDAVPAHPLGVGGVLDLLPDEPGAERHLADSGTRTHQVDQRRGDGGIRAQRPRPGPAGDERTRCFAPARTGCAPAHPLADRQRLRRRSHRPAAVPGRQVLTFRARARVRLAPPTCRTPPGQSADSPGLVPEPWSRPGFDTTGIYYDTSPAVRSRSPSWPTPDAINVAPFPAALTTNGT